MKCLIILSHYHFCSFFLYFFFFIFLFLFSFSHLIYLHETLSLYTQTLLMQYMHAQSLVLIFMTAIFGYQFNDVVQQCFLPEFSTIIGLSPNTHGVSYQVNLLNYFQNILRGNITKHFFFLLDSDCTLVLFIIHVLCIFCDIMISKDQLHSP